MRNDELPSCGPLSCASELRRAVQKAIGAAQVARMYSPSSAVPENLAAFFRACADLSDPQEAKPKKGKTS